MKLLLLILIILQLVSSQRFDKSKRDKKGRYESDRFVPGAHKLGRMKLKEKEFVSKARYVVASNNRNKEGRYDASIGFDIQISPYNYEKIDKANFLRLYVVVAEAEVE